ncbi:carboxylating nicotinate-nucleotide diphosphorylase [Chloroflexota bacterium]
MAMCAEQPGSEIDALIESALAEDQVARDVTTEALLPAGLQASASLLAKADGVLAGVVVAARVFHKVDPALKVEAFLCDGSKLHRGDVLATVEGLAASIIMAERVALNFLQRLGGIASETRRYVEAIEGTKARILDTRKTVPGLRFLDKYAVRMGGGQNHRLDLSDGVLIKDNHLVALRAQGVGLGEAVSRARQHAPHHLKVEVEVETLEQAREALEVGVDILLMDNMGLEDMRQVVVLALGHALTEASGGITLANVRGVAETGVDVISVGALTHSVRALDISLEVEPLSPA